MGAKKQIKYVKQKASWIGTSKKVFKQYVVSLWSYFTYPFKRKNEEATRKYFSHIYSGIIQDELIFDGNSGGYYKKLETLQFTMMRYDTIFDCGCGTGSLLQYLTHNQLISFDNYIGIDFALPEDKQLSQNAILIKENLKNYNFECSRKSLIVLCNVACYMSDAELNIIIGKAQKNNSDFLVIDPVPGLFWDATFDNVRLHYRSIKKMRQLMREFNFRNGTIVKDYLWHIGKCYITPLSYATLYTYNEPAD